MQFINSFLSYIVVLLVFAAVAGCAIALGIYLRKRKNQKEDV